MVLALPGPMSRSTSPTTRRCAPVSVKPRQRHAASTAASADTGAQLGALGCKGGPGPGRGWQGCVGPCAWRAHCVGGTGREYGSRLQGRQLHDVSCYQVMGCYLRTAWTQVLSVPASLQKGLSPKRPSYARYTFPSRAPATRNCRSIVDIFIS